MSKVIIKRVVIAFIGIILIPGSVYLLLKGFNNARYYQRYIEAPALAWNQMKTIQTANLPSNALMEADLNSKVIDWAANGNSINWLIRLFRYRELAAVEQQHKLLLCELRDYRLQHPITPAYFNPLFNVVTSQDQQQLQTSYMATVTKDWQQILDLNCGGE